MYKSKLCSFSSDNVMACHKIRKSNFDVDPFCSIVRKCDQNFMLASRCVQFMFKTTNHILQKDLSLFQI